jgi:hypothetical protein
MLRVTAGSTGMPGPVVVETTTFLRLPALIRRYDEALASGAPSVTKWGTGTPRREFLHADWRVPDTESTRI